MKLRHAGDDLEHRRHPEELRGENRQRADPDQDRDREPKVAAVAALEKVADGQVTVRHRLPPHARPDGEGEHQAADARRRVPPPGAQAVAIGEACGADGRAGADVAGEERREDEHRPERSAGDEEVAGGADATADPQADAGHEQGVGDEQEERAGSPQIAGGRIARNAGRGADRAHDGLGHRVGGQRADRVQIAPARRARRWRARRSRRRRPRCAPGRSRGRSRRAPSARPSSPASSSASRWWRRRRSSCSAAVRRRGRSSAPGSAAARRTSASPLPSSVRMPATTWPVAGSMMSPRALTATSAATTRPLGSVMAALPMPALHRAARGRPSCRRSRRRRRRRCLRRPDRPLPPSRRGTRTRPSAGSSRRRCRGRTGSRAGTIGIDGAAELEADALLLEIAHHAARGVEAEGAAAGEHDRVHLFDARRRREQIGLARARARCRGHRRRLSPPSRQGRPCSRSAAAVSV